MDTFKIISLFVFLTLGLSGFCAPLLFKKNAKILSNANCFSAGILFAAAFIHLLPDSVEKMEDWGGDFPFPFLFAALGFLFVFCIEEIALNYISENDPSMENPNSLARRISVTQRPKMSKSVARSRSVTPTASQLQLISVDTDIISREHSMFENIKQDHNHIQFSDDSSTVLAVILLIALSIHSFLSGIGLGAGDSSSVLVLFIAIAAHKGCAAFALGTSFVQSNTHKTSPVLFRLAALIFSCMTPLGVIIGIVLQQAEIIKTSNEGILLSIASGTFLYVATMEVMGHEFLDPDNKLQKMISLVLGFSLMSLLALWV